RISRVKAWLDAVRCIDSILSYMTASCQSGTRTPPESTEREWATSCLVTPRFLLRTGVRLTGTVAGKGVRTMNVNLRGDFSSLLQASTRSPEIPESADVYGWLCGSWDLDVLCYRGVNVADRGLRGEVHAARVLEGRAVQDVWIMPRSDERRSDSDRTMNMYGSTLRTWAAATESWRIAWTNPVRGHHEEQVGRWNG